MLFPRELVCTSNDPIIVGYFSSGQPNCRQWTAAGFFTSAGNLL